MKKHILGVLFLALFIALMLPGTVWAAITVEIWDAEDLNDMRNGLDGYYILMADIDLSETVWGSVYAEVYGTAGWVPVGTDGSRFNGTFDGGGHTITGLYINRADTNNVGLFGATGDTAEIQNLRLEDADVNVTGDWSYYAGSLVGDNRGKVINSYATGEVNGRYYVGGLVGCNTQTGIIAGCSAAGTVDGFWQVGGLLGHNHYGGEVNNSYSTSDVTGNRRVGGLVGLNSNNWGISSIIVNSYANGHVAGSLDVGGLAGENTGTINDSYYNSDTSGQSDTGKGEPITTTEMRTPITFSGWEFDSVWGINPGDNGGWPFLRLQGIDDAQFSGGQGTEAEPWEVATHWQLNNIRMRLGAHYVLVNDIDLTAYWSEGEAGWVPVGTDGSRFNGTFDGNGHTITGLYINRADTNNVGLFGATDYTAEIRNLGLVNVNVTGGQDVGSLVGKNFGIITDSYATGDIIGTDNVGGLVGRSEGSITGSYAMGDVTGTEYTGGLVGSSVGSIIDSYAMGDVTGTNYTGGLVGENNGTIKDSCATGSVSSSGSAGGLAGINYSAIESSYATGEVVANGNTGGLVGANFSTISDSYATGDVERPDNAVGGLVGFSNGTITRCYAAGLLKGTSRGGVVAWNDGTVIGSYYNAVTSGASDTGLGTPKTSAEMVQSVTFEDWDFTSVWNINAGQSYPYLRWGTPALLPAPPAATGVSVGDSTLDMTYGDVPVTLTATVEPAGVLDATVTWSTDSPGVATVDSNGRVTPIGPGDAIITATSNSDSSITGEITVTVNKKVLTITADTKSKIYGEPDPAFTVSYAGFITGEGESDLGGTLAFEREEGDAVNSYAITPSGLTSGNYEITFADGDLTITKKALTVTADDKSKIYGSEDPELTYQITAGELVNGDGISGALTRATGTDVGDYEIQQGILTAGDNYEITYVGAYLSISRKALTVTAEGKSKIYGESDPAFTVGYDGFITGEDPSVLGGTLAFDREVGEAVSSYDIAPSGLTSTNYNITFANGALTITKKDLTITAEAKSKVYGASDPAYTVSYNGFVFGEDPSTLGGTLALDREAGDAVNSYAITPSGLTSGNYEITFVDGALTITKKDLTVTADTKSKIYGESNPAFTVGYDGFITGEDPSVLGGTLALSRGSGETVGSYDITPSGITSGNYEIAFVDGALTITKKALTVTAEAKSKIYGASDPAFTVSYAGFVFGETPSALGGTLAFERITGEEVGSYDITPSGLTSGNYEITFVDGALTITKKNLTVTAEAKSKVYGETDPAFTVSYSGFITGEDESDLGGTLAFERETGEAAGSYDIIPSGVTAANYNINFAPGTLTITKKELTVTNAAAQNKVYDGTNAAILTGAVLSGVVEDDEVILGNHTTGAFAQTTIGTGVSVSAAMSISGVNAGNYTLTQPVLAADITPKELTIAGTFTVINKQYDSTNSAVINTNNLTLEGIVGADQVTLNAVAAFADANAGTGKTVSLTDASSLTGAQAGNYTLLLTGAPTATATIAAASSGDRDSSGSGGGGGGGGTPGQTPPQQPEDNTRVEADGNINTAPKLDKNTGVAATEISTATMATALEKTAADSAGKKNVEIEIPAVEGAKAYEPTLPAGTLTSGSANTQLEIKTGIAAVTMPGNMLAQQTGTAASKVSLNIAQADLTGMTEETRNQIGDRPVIQLSLKLDGKAYTWSNENAPVTVSIPYKPTAQELANPEHITVWYIDGSGNAVEIPSGRYDPVTGTVTFSTTHFSNYAVVYVSRTFDDLGSVVWAKKPIEVLASKGILKGISEKEYAPQKNITRAEFLYFLVRTLGLDAKVDGSFDDTSSTAYYYKEIAIAKKLGITSGVGNNKYNPDASITRQDMMVLAEKALRLQKKLMKQGSAADLNKFTDRQLIAAYALNSTASIVKEGLMEGSGGRFNPLGNTTRAEAAVFLYRIYNIKN